MKDRFALGADIVIVACAVGLLIWVVNRDIAPKGDAANPREALRDSIDPGSEVDSIGHQLANPRGEPRIVEFLDLQCAGCKIYHEKVVKQLLLDPQDSAVSFLVVHFPLRSHHHAIEAAVAAECAGEQGRFVEFVEIALNAQHRFAEQPWSELASAAGVAELRAYQACLARPSVRARVDAARKLGDKIGVTATPTIVIDSWRYRAPVTLEDIRAEVKAARTRKRR